LFDEEHDAFRESFRRFVEKEISPFHARWESQGRVDKEMFRAAGVQGFLGMEAPIDFGGGGVGDFRFNLVLTEELQRAGVIGSGMCITLHNDICLPYILNGADEEQRSRWLPGICSGELMLAIAMTEPGAGSDLAAMRTRATLATGGEHYLVNGSKTFITNGINSDLIIVAVKTDPAKRHGGISLLVVEGATVGFSRGRQLSKIGLKSQDTSDLHFDDAEVPAANLLGTAGSGFAQLMDNLPRERLALAMSAVSAAETAFTWTLAYCKEREAFGRPILDFQNTRFSLATMRTEIDIARSYVDRQIEALGRGELTGEDAAMSKWWTTELQVRTVSACLQMHGGYGYMTEFRIAQAFVDSRVQTIYGGTTEIMKEIIARSL
jgi:acyl-CoA dehydrogenase